MKEFLAKIISFSLPVKIGIGFATILVVGGITVPIVMNQNTTDEDVLAQVDVEANVEPAPEATVESNVEPTVEPTISPEPTVKPSEAPTPGATTVPTVSPTEGPTETPADEQAEAPTESPTAEDSEKKETAQNEQSVENTNEVIDVSGYGRNDYVPGPYNLSVDANGYGEWATAADFGGDEDAYVEWCESWSLKQVWTAPNGKMVKLKNKVPMSGQAWEERMANYENRADNDIYGTMGSDAEASKAADYWCFGENIDVMTGSGQSQNLPAVSKASSWCMDGSDVNLRFGSDNMKEYHKILARILFKMRNPNEEPDGSEIGTYGVMYDPTHVSMVAFMAKAFEFRFFGDYINIQIYKDLNEVDKQVFHDYLNLLTPIGDQIYDDIMYSKKEGLTNRYPHMLNYDTWYEAPGYYIYVTDTAGEEYLEYKIKP